MRTSEYGIAFLERHEGVVLKAYRDVVGVWTIGVGLTKASGVVDPAPGMTITRAQSEALLAKALAANYEPAVEAEMIGAEQHEFDAAVSFHFNTGGIRQATWVDAWHAHDWRETKRRLLLWVKGGGKVLPALERRREAEYRLLSQADYGVAGEPPEAGSDDWTLARIVLPLSPSELAALRQALASLGYEPGEDATGVSVTCVRYFQIDHDLTADGIIGKATLSTVQRMIDARRKAALTAVAGGGAGTSPALAEPTGVGELLPAWVDWIIWAVLALALIRLAWLAWTYRDALAARVQHLHPRLADWLRSF